MASVLIAGDLCPLGRNRPLFQRGDVSPLFNDLLPEFEKADLSIVNLECPLIREEAPIKKSGPNLAVEDDCINGIAAAGIDVVNLANNHIMDHGPLGLRNTLDTCTRHNIRYVGAGENLAVARHILVLPVNGIRIGILSVAEHEFGIASKSRPGANPLDMRDFVRNIQENREAFDYLIVLVHGGIEHHPYPRPELWDTCRFMVEQGANAVICQHTHCPGCHEFYRDAPIVYGQGNFIFDYPTSYPSFHQGFLVRLHVDVRQTMQMDCIPFVQSDSRPGARRMPRPDEEAFLAELAERSGALEDEALIDRLWRAFCQQNKAHYLNMLHGKKTLLRRLAGRLNLLSYLDSETVYRSRLHMIRCESLREAIVTILSSQVSQ